MQAETFVPPLRRAGVTAFGFSGWSLARAHATLFGDAAAALLAALAPQAHDVIVDLAAAAGVDGPARIARAAPGAQVLAIVEDEAHFAQAQARAAPFGTAIRLLRAPLDTIAAHLGEARPGKLIAATPAEADHAQLQRLFTAARAALPHGGRAYFLAHVGGGAPSPTQSMRAAGFLAVEARREWPIGRSKQILYAARAA